MTPKIQAATSGAPGVAGAPVAAVRAAATVVPYSRHAVARCACGRQYSHETWAALPWDGDQPSGIDAIVLEMARCVCGSTICRARRGSEYIPAAEWAEIEARADRSTP